MYMAQQWVKSLKRLYSPPTTTSAVFSFTFCHSYYHSHPVFGTHAPSTSHTQHVEYILRLLTHITFWCIQFRGAKKLCDDLKHHRIHDNHCGQLFIMYRMMYGRIRTLFPITHSHPFFFVDFFVAFLKPHFHTTLFAKPFYWSTSLNTFNHILWKITSPMPRMYNTHCILYILHVLMMATALPKLENKNKKELQLYCVRCRMIIEYVAHTERIRGINDKQTNGFVQPPANGNGAISLSVQRHAHN